MMRLADLYEKDAPDDGLVTGMIPLLDRVVALSIISCACDIHRFSHSAR